MKVIIHFAGALILAAQPVLADRLATGIMLMRDSDGIVISVIHPLDYATFPPVFAGGGVVYMLGGHVLEFSTGPGVMVMDMAGGGAAGSVGPTAVVAGTTYRVEAKGLDLWLIDPVTGQRHATQRMASMPGAARVNPNGFAMD
jgi:hypothetical protein